MKIEFMCTTSCTAGVLRERLSLLLTHRNRASRAPPHLSVSGGPWRTCPAAPPAAARPHQCRTCRSTGWGHDGREESICAFAPRSSIQLLVICWQPEQCNVTLQPIPLSRASRAAHTHVTLGLQPLLEEMSNCPCLMTHLILSKLNCPVISPASHSPRHFGVRRQLVHLHRRRVSKVPQVLKHRTADALDILRQHRGASVRVRMRKPSTPATMIMYIDPALPARSPFPRCHHLGTAARSRALSLTLQSTLNVHGCCSPHPPAHKQPLRAPTALVLLSSITLCADTLSEKSGAKYSWYSLRGSCSGTGVSVRIEVSYVQQRATLRLV